MAKLSCFDIYKMCLNKQKWVWKESDKVDFDSFVACRWLSGSSRTIQIGNFLNFYHKFLPDKVQYEFIQNSTSEKFIKFPKANTKKEDTQEIMKKYNISYEKSLEYKELLDFLNFKTK